MKPIIFLLFTLAATARGQREGESCIDQYANSVGRCTVVDQCQSAKRDFQLNGIRPTFCSYTTFGAAIVCCRDGSNILQSPTTRDGDQRPIWGNADGGQTYGRRVSERKCEEYSRAVVEKVPYIPLIPNPEPFTVSAAKCDYTGVELIVGGENANPGEFPHMAAVGWATFEGPYKFSCGGSLISPRFVVTAGHCIRDPSAQNPEPVIVRLGDQNIDNTVNDGANPIDVAIRRIHKHPDYRPPKVYNDIALLELVSDVKFRSAIRPACLWFQQDLRGHQKVIATGWGVVDTRTKQSAKELQKVSLSVLDEGFCNETLKFFFNRNWPDGFQPTQMCAGELSGGKDTCQGDSGSPLQVVSTDNSCIFHVVGVTSFGRNCADKGRPAVYTRIASYVDWIESVVWPGE
ncbi:serine protease snake-like [Spodoptera litura]|uniref:trypsin n=1 Tax=Spodoptera litura TaxID=69820 RepID=A0A9J7EQE7_SPOLT|nr:serine protease snake-like [Spodoptera litura]